MRRVRTPPRSKTLRFSGGWCPAARAPRRCCSPWSATGAAGAVFASSLKPNPPHCCIGLGSAVPAPKLTSTHRRRPVPAMRLPPLAPTDGSDTLHDVLPAASFVTTTHLLRSTAAVDAQSAPTATARSLWAWATQPPPWPGETLEGKVLGRQVGMPYWHSWAHGRLMSQTLCISPQRLCIQAAHSLISCDAGTSQRALALPHVRRRGQRTAQCHAAGSGCMPPTTSRAGHVPHASAWRTATQISTTAPAARRSSGQSQAQRPAPWLAAPPPCAAPQQQLRALWQPQGRLQRWRQQWQQRPSLPSPLRQTKPHFRRRCRYRSERRLAPLQQEQQPP